MRTKNYFREEIITINFLDKINTDANNNNDTDSN